MKKKKYVLVIFNNRDECIYKESYYSMKQLKYVMYRGLHGIDVYHYWSYYKI